MLLVNVPGTWESAPQDDPGNPLQFPNALLHKVTASRELPIAAPAWPIIAASSPPMLVGLHTHTRVLFWASSEACTYGSCHFHRPSCGTPHMPLPSTPPYCCRPARMAPL
ncbi:hypothetical protein PICSAR65_03903 [Mycobacterium avium subsp. paratuberculosis]|nr:hypothetical protein PICSAR65_03903 [Mycobacterium avium subsp. paratuberculosis]